MSSTTAMGSSATSMPMASSMPASVMEMVFYSSTTTPLYSASWSPTSTGSYAGTCIFLIVLGTIFRGLMAVKHAAEGHWREVELNRRPIVVRTPSSSEADGEPILDRKETKTVNFLERSLASASGPLRRERKPTPWRLSVDLPRAALVTITAGVGYLL
jgi:solute carrier family 31 (copper transporter), member 1